MIRLFDFLFSLLIMLILSPFFATVAIIIFLSDFHSPFFLGERVGLNGKPFLMVKFRSMRIHAQQTKVDSTSVGDPRITPIGHFVRRFKLDELMQFWNVLRGQMSLVGPRPNVPREVAIYTEEERGLLRVRPGITDISSIVFSDEGEILAGSKDPDLTYNQLIRPWKSKLGLFCIQHQSFSLNIKIIVITFISIISRATSLRLLRNLVQELGASPELIAITARSCDLVPVPPPGATRVVTDRDSPPV